LLILLIQFIHIKTNIVNTVNTVIPSILLGTRATWRCGIQPAKWHSVLALLTGTDLVIQDLGGRGQVVSSVGDRLSSWEYSLASAASATKAFCPKCSAHDCFFPTSAEREGARSIITWPSGACGTTKWWSQQ